MGSAHGDEKVRCDRMLSIRNIPSSILWARQAEKSVQVCQALGESIDDSSYKIACDRLPLPNEDVRASQPTLSRLENQMGKQASAVVTNCLYVIEMS